MGCRASVANSCHRVSLVRRTSCGKHGTILGFHSLVLSEPGTQASERIRTVNPETYPTQSIPFNNDEQLRISREVSSTDSHHDRTIFNDNNINACAVNSSTKARNQMFVSSPSQASLSHNGSMMATRLNQSETDTKKRRNDNHCQLKRENGAVGSCNGHSTSSADAELQQLRAGREDCGYYERKVQEDKTNQFLVKPGEDVSHEGVYLQGIGNSHQTEVRSSKALNAGNAPSCTGNWSTTVRNDHNAEGDSCVPVIPNAALFNQTMSKEGSLVNREIIEGGQQGVPLRSYSQRRRLFVIPPHLQQSTEFNDIVLESSIVIGCLGELLMLPWSEEDEDVSNNCWINDWPSSVDEAFRKYFWEDYTSVVQRIRKVPGNDGLRVDPCTSLAYTVQPQFRVSLERQFNRPLECSSSCVFQSEDGGEDLALSSNTTRNHRLCDDEYCSCKEVTSFPTTKAGGHNLVPPACHFDKSVHTQKSGAASDVISNLTEKRSERIMQPNGLSGVREETETEPCHLSPVVKASLTTTAYPLYRSGSLGDNKCFPQLPPCVSRDGRRSRRSVHLSTQSTFQMSSECKLLRSCFNLYRVQPSESHGHYCSSTKKNILEGSVTKDDYYQNHPSVICRMNYVPASHFTNDTLINDIRANLSINSFVNGWSLKDGRFTDVDGYTGLSKKQQKKFFAWKRITDLKLPRCQSPTIIHWGLESRQIRQGFVGDCSFLSSLAVLVQYENRHHVPVISSIIHPQQQHPLYTTCKIPVVNPSGKPLGSDTYGTLLGVDVYSTSGFYACRVFFNGVARKVILDDYLPVRQGDKVLSAHSADRNEFWVSLLEKCFIKLMGGSYFMRGSNPGTDMYHLTGWIPETIPFHMDVQSGSPDNCRVVVTGGYDMIDHSIDSQWNSVWDQLYDALCLGKCVACLGTSEIADSAPSGLDYPEGVSQSSGLVARHAYSILDYRAVQNKRLLYLKNPWCCIRWREAYSPYDKRNWTNALQQELCYNRAQAAAVDDGCFWIEWSDVVKWFSHLYLCWNPTCFPFHSLIHSKWECTSYAAHSLLADDSHVVAFNPQFLISINPASVQGCSMFELWIFLSRHVRERKRDLSEKYLALHVYRGSQRLCCPAPPLKQGIYSNGECTLVKLMVNFSPNDTPVDCAKQHTVPSSLPLSTSISHNSDERASSFHDSEYVLVVSQYSRKEELNFTIKTYSAVHTTITPLPLIIPPDVTPLSRYIKGSWSSSSAGGCSNDVWSYFMNPHVRLYLPQSCNVLLFLECPQEFSVNIRIVEGKYATPRLLRSSKTLSSGAYRSGCCYFQKRLKAGHYSLIVSTYHPGKIGDFQLALHMWDFRDSIEDGSLPSRGGELTKGSTCVDPKDIIFRCSPYPYAIPPAEHFFYQTIEVNTDQFKRMLHLPLDSLFQLSREGDTPQYISLSLQVEVKHIVPTFAYPSIVVYRQRHHEKQNDQSQNNDSQLDIEPIGRSDLEGGHTNGTRRFSSASLDLYQKLKIGTLTILDIDMRYQPYYIRVTPVVLRKCSESPFASFVSFDDENISDITSQSLTSLDFVLHVISDSPISITNLTYTMGSSLKYIVACYCLPWNGNAVGYERLNTKSIEANQNCLVMKRHLFCTLLGESLQIKFRIRYFHKGIDYDKTILKIIVI